MTLDSLLQAAQHEGASDLHLEAGLPAAVRVRGALRTVGEPVPGKTLLEIAQGMLDPDQWQAFLVRRSFDLSKTFSDTRCRINILQTARGIGFAIRLLSSFQATLESLNLHPDLRKFTTATNGLILVSGPTGSGKSSTLAALIQEINATEARHIVTVESPIEYTFRPRKSFIRQREVGRDTPSFEQALLDSLREDPDVLMVGEMRDPETMRLTLNASETGHLVLATVHSSTCAEALQRVVSAFPSEIQNSVAAQLSDCLAGAISQRLIYNPELKLRLPECEILFPTHAIKNFIRNRDFFKITSSLETGADRGLWTYTRYKNWMEKKKNWHIPAPGADLSDAEHPPVLNPALIQTRSPTRNPPKSSAPSVPSIGAGRIEIEPVEGGIETLLKNLE